MSLCSLFTTSQAQSTDSNSLLWEISGNGLQQSSWLYGTIHLVCPEDLHFSPATLSAVKTSKQLFLEINIDDKEAMAKLQQDLFMPEGYSFKSLLPEADYAQLAVWFKDSMQIDLLMLDRVKPLVMVTLLSRYFLASSCSKPVSCEEAFIELAKAQQLPIRGLETVADQLSIFDSIPDTEEAASLVKTIHEKDKWRETYREMITAYRKGNVDQVHQLILETPDVEKYQDILLYNRNRNWIPIIKKQVQDTPSFFAVGAGHLGGPAGVIALLRKEGYTVQSR